MKRINLAAAIKQLEDLKRIQANRDFLPMFFIKVNDNGSISTGNGAGAKFFENIFDIPDPPGLTPKTLVFVEDFVTVPDGLYLPADPLWYWCTTEERRTFIELDMVGDHAGWMDFYVGLITALQTDSIANPNMYLPAFDDPALKDLWENHNRFKLEELVGRYKDQRWFVPYDPKRHT